MGGGRVVVSHFFVIFGSKGKVLISKSLSFGDQNLMF